MNMPEDKGVYHALEVLRRKLPEAADGLRLDLGKSGEHWRRTIDRKLLPRLSDGFPLVAAICGGGSAGKSTLFNTLTGTRVSPTGGQAGLNRRVLIGTGEPVADGTPLWQDLQQTFDAAPEALPDGDALLTPGEPLYTVAENLPANLVLLDTPDIDTGARGVYTNRDLARRSLEAADLFIYIFTNATYNNRDITDFISGMITDMGRRPCFLVYRVYPSFTDKEVNAHAQVVASNIYGPAAQHHVLGLYRVDEDNAVAADTAPMHLRSLSPHPEPLLDALAALDPGPLRRRLLDGMLMDAIAHARRMHATVRGANDELGRYACALRSVQGQCVQDALSHFPSDRVLRRFTRIWTESDPAHIKIMRRTGRVVEWPLKTIVSTLRRLKSPGKLPQVSRPEDASPASLEMDLLNAANKLYRHCLENRLTTGDRVVEAPAVIEAEQTRLQQAPWQDTLESILAHQDEIVSWSLDLDAELQELAADLRSRMGLLGQVRQTFAAMLNVIPATAAVTYVLHTGDPVGAAGIKVKLTGLFGLNDMYALIAIPATAGITRADRSQLVQLLGPLAKAWLENKLKVIQTLFEIHISGGMLERLEEAHRRTADLLTEIESALADCPGPA